MRQKYVLTRSGNKDTLTISEYTELEKDTFSLICEESHAAAAIRSAIAEGTDKLISVFRTHNMYPRMVYAEKIAEGIIRLYESAGEDTLTLLFDDKDAFPGADRIGVVSPDLVVLESEAADDLIDDELDIDVDADEDIGVDDEEA